MFENKIIHNENFHKLDKNSFYLLGHIFETSYLFDKVKNKLINLSSFYGDPDCGLN